MSSPQDKLPPFEHLEMLGEQPSQPGAAPGPAGEPLPSSAEPAPEGTEPAAEAGLEGLLGTMPEGEAPSEEPKGDEAAEEESKEEKPGLLARLSEISPYTIFLALALLALVVGSWFLWAELGRYNRILKKRNVQQQVQAATGAGAQQR